MKVLAKEKIGETRYLTEENYLICVDAILARTGKQTYTRDEVFGDSSDEEIEVVRLPEEVFNEKTIASFENKPITINHPTKDVNSENVKDLAVGFVRNVRRSTTDGYDVIIGNLIITHQEAIDQINDGLTSLSCGYSCDIEERDKDYFQTNIRGNHVALCETPRAGITMIRDNKSGKIKLEDEDKILTFDSLEEVGQYVQKQVRVQDWNINALFSLTKLLSLLKNKDSKVSKSILEKVKKAIEQIIDSSPTNNPSRDS